MLVREGNGVEWKGGLGGVIEIHQKKKTERKKNKIKINLICNKSCKTHIGCKKRYKIILLILAVTSKLLLFFISFFRRLCA